MNLREKAKEFNKNIMQISGYGALKINVDARNKTISDDDIIVYKSMIGDWTQGKYIKDDVRLYNGLAMRCVQDHDSTNDLSHNPTVKSLWTVLHGRTPETAQEWVQPLGSHDQYLKGEYCIYNGVIYHCVDNTVHVPDVFGWELYGVYGETEPIETEESEEDPETPAEPETPKEYPIWKQPQGAHDAYQYGDIVWFNGKLYKSINQGANAHSPAVFPGGWELVE